MSPMLTLKIALSSALVFLGIAGTSVAQHHHHHHHHGGRSSGSFFGGFGYPGYSSFGYSNSPYGYGYGYGYGSGIGVRIYSTPRYYTAPQYHYSTPQYYTTPQTVIVESKPVAPQPTFDNGPIVITNPASNDKPAEYTLNGHRFSIKPGQSQKFNHDRDWVVEFSRGEGKETAHYGLKSATYKFKPTDKGWELFEAAATSRTTLPEPPTDE